MKLMEEKQVERLYVPSPKWNRVVGLGGWGGAYKVDMHPYR